MDKNSLSYKFGFIYGRVFMIGVGFVLLNKLVDKIPMGTKPQSQPQPSTPNK